MVSNPPSVFIYGNQTLYGNQSLYHLFKFFFSPWNQTTLRKSTGESPTRTWFSPFYNHQKGVIHIRGGCGGARGGATVPWLPTPTTPVSSLHFLSPAPRQLRGGMPYRCTAGVRTFQKEKKNQDHPGIEWRKRNTHYTNTRLGVQDKWGRLPGGVGVGGEEIHCIFLFNSTWKKKRKKGLISGEVKFS